MPKCVKMEIGCPECENKQMFTAWETVMADLDPYLKDKILNGELFLFTCEKCGKKFPVTYPCLYHDAVGRLLVYLSPEKDAIQKMNDILYDSPEAFERQVRDGYTYRVVNTVNEMAEKIMIHDMKQDDRVIEIIKLLILFKSVNEGMDIDSVAGMFYYPGKEHKHEILIMYQDGKQALVPVEEDLIRETMENLGERIRKNTEEGYQAINIEWASKILE